MFIVELPLFLLWPINFVLLVSTGISILGPQMMMMNLTMARSLKADP